MFGVLLRFRIWLRAVCWVGCFAALGVTIAYWARGQEGRSASEQQQRLERLERAAEELLNQVRALRQEQSQPPPSTSTSGQEPGRRSRTEPLPPVVLPDSWLKWIQWRSIGPANMGGRIVDLAVCESDPSTFWVATASGGLLKTTNNGITFEHQFDHEATVSIGAVAVAPSDPNIVWVGTGENNPRNSVSYGDGVYKSTDGGKTWKNMGLRETFQIGRIVIHPNDPNIVYVGALGRLYGPNEERGVFKTMDGGETWEKVLYIDERTGIIDLRMHPQDPDTLIAAAWERRRDIYDSWPGNEEPIPDGYNVYDPVVKWGAGSGLYKTTDGGKTWKKLTQGLPTSALGRIGLDWYRKDPNVVFAIIDCENIAKGPRPLNVFTGIVAQDIDGTVRVIQVMPDSPAEKAGVRVGDEVKAVGESSINSFDQLLETLRPRRPGESVRLKLVRDGEPMEVDIELAQRPGTGRPNPLLFAGAWFGAAAETRQGVLTVTMVVPDGPADKAGLEVGDQLLEADKRKLSDVSDLAEVLRSHAPGDRLVLVLKRGEATQEVEVELEERPAALARLGGQAASNVFMGIQGEDAPGGARLTQVTPDGPAEKAGLQAGDIITHVNDQPISGYQDLVLAIRQRQPGDKLKVKVRRGDAEREFEVTLQAREGTTTRPYAYASGGQAPNVQDQQGSKGFEYGGVYKSIDGGETWTRINSLNPRPMYFSQIRVDPNDDKYVYVLGVSQHRSTNGGVTFDSDYGRGVHADGHALWIDPRDGRHMIIGTDGGVYVTYDRGQHWDHLNHAAVGQFYHVAISPSTPYRVTGGLQDNGTWLGPSLSKNGQGPINEDWINVNGGDGFMCRVDPEDPDLVYATSQDGNMVRRNLRTGERVSIRPRPPAGERPYRFNWNTPFILSSHNPRIFYCAGNYVFRSLNRGSNPQRISPEITRTKRGSATALAESPRNPNVLYVGTDDGYLWVTQDGGQHWVEVSGNVGLPGPRWVATIEASRFAEGRVYVAFDGHRSDDDEPYVFVSEDFGQTWRSLRANLPRGSTRCLREDVQNENLLFLGTEFGAWFSLDRGSYWNKFNTNLPTVAVHELAVHPGNGELIAATHGRSLWITDVSWLRQIRPEHLTSDVVLYQPSEVIRWHREPSRGSTNRRFVGQNPSNDAQIYYVLPENAQNVTLRVLDVEGNVLRELRASKEPGLNRVVWDLTRTRNERPAGAPSGRSGGALGGRGRSQERPPMSGGQQERPTEQAREQPREASQQPASQTEPPEEQRPSPMRSGIGRGGFGAAGRGGFAFGQAARPVPAGTYRLVLSVDGRDVQRTIVIRNDPSAPADALTADSELYWESLEVENEEQEELWREEWGGEAELDEAPDTWID
ncbi:MAG: hypothetical protein KatS3mg110_0836 [Pirellulaceae bacterium]|nr:MAG: hypothetical protein KatS3mg110_0836 [Pirellulaceae bacterium]